jgi:hypothetical protein
MISLKSHDGKEHFWLHSSRKFPVIVHDLRPGAAAIREACSARVTREGDATNRRNTGGAAVIPDNLMIDGAGLYGESL